MIRRTDTRFRRFLRVALVTAMATIVAGCSPPPPPDAIILISIDSLRADHLGVYGYERDTSPNLDALEQEAVVFEHALAPAPWTLPSHMSMLTALNPSVHGVTKDGARLANDATMVSEVFQSSGWSTAAVVAGPYVSGEFGFTQGFDVYDDETVFFSTNRQSHRGRTSLKTQLRALELIDDMPSQPFFLFLHYWDVHYDYEPPFPFNEMFDPDYEGTINGRNFEVNQAINNRMDRRDIDHLVSLYDGEIAAVDVMLGRLFAELRRRNLWENSLVVVTADHGDEFFEHGRKGHRKNLYETVLHVPLIIKFPQAARGGTRVSETVGTVDISPTLLDVANLPALVDANGTSLVARIDTQDTNPSPYFADLGGTRKAVVAGPYKLIHDPQAPPELYDFETDSGETTNLIAELPDVYSALARVLNTWTIASAEQASRLGVEGLAYDPEMLDALRSLGYVR